jgi:L-ascorbate metabolism protein UlaG (beta-lactamase superfamily)
MKIKYLSHACFELANGRTLLIDPYFTGNPLAPPYHGNPDMILVTHEHGDHGADAKNFDALVVCPPNCSYKKMVQMKIGEKKSIEGLDFEMVASSHHQSKYAAGYIFTFAGKRIYHPGDTYLDGVKPQKGIDIFFIPIGGYYTMNIDEAIEALKIIKPSLAIPMHYDTFPQIKADPQMFKKKAEVKGFSVKVFGFGEEAQL